VLQRYPELPPAFFLREVTKVARDLLGKGLLVIQGGKPLLAEIVETEAYRGLGDDPASHCHRGETKRNGAMFAVGGTCYVYLSYGLNHCMNVVTGPVGQGSGILLRAAAPWLGAEQMALNRGLPPGLSPKVARNLLSGPGKLTQAFGIDLRHNGGLFSKKTGVMLVDLGKHYGSKEIAATPRIGISVGTDHLWRFVVRDSPWLSRPFGNPAKRPKLPLS
jgi:DNA-3-methyladenine glycosylase